MEISVISAILTILLAVGLMYAAKLIIGWMELEAKIRKPALIIAGVLCLLYLFGAFFGMFPFFSLPGFGKTSG